MHRLPLLRSSFLSLALLLGLCHSLPAQTSAANATPAKPAAAETQAEQPKGRPDQRIEHIHVEDSGARIDELRVGGETQRITVKPKSGMPEYEILPTDGKNSPPALTRDGSPRGSGERVWKVLSF